MINKWSLLGLLYRDGFMYFVVIFGMTILNLVIWLTQPLQLSGVSITLVSLLIALLDTGL
jgi:hypothetical protein